MIVAVWILLTKRFAICVGPITHVARAYHTADDINIGEGFVFHCTQSPLIEHLFSKSPQESSSMVTFSHVVHFRNMNTKILLSLVIAVVIIVTGGYFVLSPYAKNVEEASYAKDDSANQRQRVIEGVFAPNFPKETPKDTQVHATATPSIKTKGTDFASTPKPSSSKYTLVTVGQHNGKESCWSIINGNVYDLTPFVSKYSGGDGDILKICGKDGSSAFMEQYGGVTKPESALVTFYLGKLSQ